MVKTLNAPLVGLESRGPTPAVRTPRRVGGLGGLAAVAAAFTLLQLVLVRPGMGLGWDEAVYVSQVSGHTPAAFFSAPRSRGISLLAAPIASWSSSTSLLRVYLAVLSGLGLFLALRIWRGLFPERVVVLAGVLFATLWVTVFYGPEVMPNYWVAIGALAGVGCFLRAQADRHDRAALWGAGASAALLAWMRPTDAVWVVLPLFVLLVCVRRWRRPRLLAALVVGLGSGAVGWVAEAYVSFGGLGARLADASRIQGGLGWNIAVLDQLRGLGGQTLCRPCDSSLPAPQLIAWWFALPLLAAVALAVAVKGRRTARTLLPLACAMTASIPYLFMIGYAAPRFLLPFYALLAIPVADALVHLVNAAPRAWRPAAVTLAALAFAGHLAMQYVVLEDAVARSTAGRQEWARTAAELHRLGVRPPCVLNGYEALPIAFYAGCSSAQTQGHNANTTREDFLRTARRTPTATLATEEEGPPGYARDWPSHRFGDLRIHVSPAARAGTRE
ncbi:hypothetical protein OG302_38760 [Streptomyces sp. NBC_01283]|uniref:hypothetical protein n=1 Tax=Streptomyces sp. NBC_01283 TaxID=2903812 RepID=UPI00352C1826|nr:hypothetical protein OG302_38760 [Streptomyces sp. NBC_01283]